MGVTVTVSLDKDGNKYKGKITFGLETRRYDVNVSVSDGVTVLSCRRDTYLSSFAKNIEPYFAPLAEAREMIDKQWSDVADDLAKELKGSLRAHADVKRTLQNGDSWALKVFLDAL